MRRYLFQSRCYSCVFFKNCLCLGDGNNDVEMLTLAGIGVAMAEATDSAKDAADYITDDIDENGWANAIRHFGLID